MYPGLAKFFKKKKPVHIKTIYIGNNPPKKVFDNGRRGTTKVNDLLQFLLAETIIPEYSDLFHLPVKFPSKK